MVGRGGLLGWIWARLKPIESGLCFAVPLTSCSLIPSLRQFNILCDAPAILVKPPDVKLRVRQTMSRRLTVPFHRLQIILLGATAVIVAIAHLIFFGRREALLLRSGGKRRIGQRVLRGWICLRLKPLQGAFREGIAPIGGPLVPNLCLVDILRDAPAVFIKRSNIVLSVCESLIRSLSVPFHRLHIVLLDALAVEVTIAPLVLFGGGRHKGRADRSDLL